MLNKLRRKVNRIRERRGPRLRLAFVGCGAHATTNLYPALRHAPVDVVAVCARRRERAERTARQFGARRAYDDWRAMLDTESLPAVMVCVNPAVHAEVAAEALQRGMAVWVEKPPAPTAADARRLAELSRETGRPLMVGFQKRFAPAYVEAKRIAASREFGLLHHVGLRFAVGATASAWDFLFDVAIHALDLARWFGGDVAGLHTERVGDDRAASWAVALRLTGGAVGTLHLSNRGGWALPNERVELWGEGGFVAVDNLTRLVYHRRTGAPPGVAPPSREQSRVWEPNPTAPTAENQSLFLNGYAHEVRAFVEAVLRDRPASPDINDGHQALRLVEAVWGSEGRTVEL